MNKQTAITHVVKHLEAGETQADKYFVTKDGRVYTKAALAVAHASHLSPGNPTLVEVEHTELSDVPPPPPSLTKEEEEIQARIEQAEALEQEKKSVEAEISTFGTEDDIDELNAEQKLHVANLKERLDDINQELAILNAGK